LKVRLPENQIVDVRSVRSELATDVNAGDIHVAQRGS